MIISRLENLVHVLKECEIYRYFEGAVPSKTSDKVTITTMYLDGWAGWKLFVIL